MRKLKTMAIALLMPIALPISMQAQGLPPGGGNLVDRVSILRLVLRDAMIPTAIGLAIGIAASFGFRRLLDSLVSGLTAVSPLTLGVVVLILAATAVLAALVPARRAAYMDPMRTLRHE